MNNGYLFDAAESATVTFESPHDPQHFTPIESKLDGAEARVIETGTEEAFAGIEVRYAILDVDGVRYTVTTDDGEYVTVQSTDMGDAEMHCSVEHFEVEQ